MGSMTLASLAVVTQLTVIVPNADELPLHQHPTLVQMLEENNRQRASVGLPPQTMSPELTKAAQDHANYMAEHGVFSHYVNGGPSGRAARYGFPGSVSENIAVGYDSISRTFQGWRHSSGHWANMTSSAPLAGFGYAISESGRCYWVGMYGR